MKIILGKSDSRNIELDLDVLLRTRLLVQANSGGGKSYALRRILEQAFGKVQCIVIDPAGEFATLREKFGYVLVGEHGETPADIRSAGLVAEKLLELRASAVCDLYGLKPSERHLWLKRFLSAIMNAPKRLWHPALFVVDEAHKFAPEKGEGESEAKGEMLQLASDGRKYGFCAIYATQRLAKLDKSAASELLNVMIGPTFMDIDLERAHKALGIVHADWRDFDARMKTIEPGYFWALGRAVCTSKILVKIGSVQTTHPEAGSAKHAAEPPPPPEKVKALLPKLADLPKAAEEQARTVAELKQEIRSLKGQLGAQPVKTEMKEIKIIDQAAISLAIKRRDMIYDRQMRKLTDGLMRISTLAQEMATKQTLIPAELPTPIGRLSHIASTEQMKMKRLSPRNIERGKQIVSRLVAKTQIALSPNGDATLGKCEAAILAALAQHGECDIGRLALLSGYRKSGGFKNSISKLRRLGYLEGSNIEVMRITDEGLRAGEWDELPTGRRLFEYWMNSQRMGTCERVIMKTLDGRGTGLTLAEIAEASGYAISGGFKNSLSKLRTAGVIVGRNMEKMRLSEELIE